MSFDEISVGDVVEDKWWPTTIYGKIVKKMKTRVVLRKAGGEEITYDAAHCVFLRRIER